MSKDHVPEDFIEKPKVCQCELCVYGRDVQSVIERRDPDELIKVVTDLMNANYNQGADINYYECILNGSWPSAVEQLEQALQKAREIRDAEAKKTF